MPLPQRRLAPSSAPGWGVATGQPLGRASPDDESGLEPRFSVPSAVGGTRCAAAVNHSFIASVQASQWGGVAYSPAIRPRPLGPRQGGALPAGFAESRGGGLAMKLLHLILGALSLFVAIFLMLYARSWRLEAVDRISTG